MYSEFDQDNSKIKPSFNFNFKNLIFGKGILKIGTAVKYGVFNGNIQTDHLYNNYLSYNGYEYNIKYHLLSFGLVFQAQLLNREHFALYFDLTPYYHKLTNHRVETKFQGVNIKPSYVPVELSFQSKLSINSTIAAMINPSNRLVPIIGISNELHRNVYLRYTVTEYTVSNTFINIGMIYKLYQTE